MSALNISRRVLALALTLATLLVADDISAQGRQSGKSLRGKLDRHLQQRLEKNEDSTEQVIIRVEPGAAKAVEALLRRRGDRSLRYHPSIGAFTARSKKLLALTESGLIKSISVDAPLQAHQVFTPLPTQEVVRRSLGLSATWTGAGIGVAVIDSGLEPSVDFGARVTAFYDFTQGGVATAPYDDYGHGTHVAGLIGSSGTLSGGAYRGIAPNVRLVGLKVLDSAGGGMTSDVISAVEFATANRAALGIDIINLSLGHPPFESAATDPLVQAVEAASRAGIVVVASAGNYGRNATTGQIGYAGSSSQGTAPTALTVGSLATQDTVQRHDDRINGFSSRGPTYFDGSAKPDIVAPGYRLIANAAKNGSLYQSYPTLRVSGTVGLDYMTLSGTSMAAAVATGVVAQMLEANRVANPTRRLPVNAVKAVLQHTASRVKDDAGVEYDYLTQGAGAVNAAGAIPFGRAIRNLTSFGQSWLDPALSADSGSSGIDGEVYPWSDTVVWGNKTLRGNTANTSHSAWDDTVVWGNNDTVVWGTTVVWGNNVVWDDTVVWGTTVIWGNAVLQGNTVVWGNNDLASGTGANSILWGNTLVDAVP